MRATHGLAYWSRELLRVNTAIEQHVASGRTNIKRRSTARKENDDANAKQ